ncbi:MAG: hypothetical protein PHU21_02370 [Elusimicrobia bacterium]|nr:hypothetical protein [Elusimicrobiota bacterium]
MDTLQVGGGLPLRGRLRPPSDETLSHVALLLGAMAGGHTIVERLSPSLDVHCTWSCLMDLGVAISSTTDGEQTAVRGLGWRGLAQPKLCLKAGESGATVRLLMGVIAANPIAADIIGDEGLRRFPLLDVAAALRRMGAAVHLQRGSDCAPVCVLGRALKGASHVLPQACEHLRAAVLLAGTMALGETSVTEPFPSDTRLEGLLALFGADIRRKGLTTTVKGGKNLAGRRLAVAPDLSWAAFWALAAGLNPGSELFIEGVAPEDSRSGVLAVLLLMGLRSDWLAGGFRVRSQRLHGADLPADQAAADLPLLAVAASQAKGASRLRGALAGGPEQAARLLGLLDSLGVRAGAEGEDLVVSGPTPLRPGRVSVCEDERLARAGLLAGLLDEGGTVVSEAGIVSDRYPRLLKQLARLR